MNLVPPPPPPGYGKTPPAKVTLVGDKVKLSDEQHLATQRIENEDYEVMVLTGCAGAGKSTVANFLMRVLNYSCCATTGKASVVNGSFWTADAMFGFGRDDWKVKWDRAARGVGRRNVSETILIDEGSMVGAKMLTPILEVCRKYGKRVVLVGDWAQAKPVKDEWITKHPDFDRKNIIRLLDCHRQTDRDLIDALNDVRRGISSDLASRIFGSRRVIACPEAPGIIRMVATNKEADAINGKYLTALIKRTKAEPVMLMCVAQDIRDEDAQRKWPLEPRFYAQKKDESSFAHRDEVAVGAQVLFTANARVTNFEDCEEEGFIPERSYVNGDVGIIEEIWYNPTAAADEESTAGITAVEASLPVLPAASQQGLKEMGLITEPISTMTFQRDPVQLSTTVPAFLLQSRHIKYVDIRITRTGRMVRVYRHKTEFLDQNRNPKLAVIGWPFRLGWAMTIHKAQGSTVDKAWLDLESIRKMPAEGRHGLAYVGLSRTRTLEGLYLGSWDPSVIVCDPEVKDLI